MKKLREVFDGGGTAADQKEGAALVSRALEHERAALATIQRPWMPRRANVGSVIRCHNSYSMVIC